MAGLTVCFCLGGVGTGIALFILVRYVNLQQAIEGPPARYALLAAPFLLHGGFGIAWLLAGLLFIYHRRVWGWTAIAVGISIPGIFTWLFAP